MASKTDARERAIRAMTEMAPGMGGCAEDFVDALLDAVCERVQGQAPTLDPHIVTVMPLARTVPHAP